MRSKLIRFRVLHSASRIGVNLVTETVIFTDTRCIQYYVACIGRVPSLQVMLSRACLLKAKGRDRLKSVANFFRNFSLRHTASADNFLPVVQDNGSAQFDRTRLAPPSGDGRERLQFPDVFSDPQRRRKTSPSDRSPSDDGLLLPPVDGRISPRLIKVDYIRWGNCMTNSKFDCYLVVYFYVYYPA